MSEKELKETIETLNAKIGELTELLEAEKAKNKILNSKIDELAGTTKDIISIVKEKGKGLYAIMNVRNNGKKYLAGTKIDRAKLVGNIEKLIKDGVLYEVK